MLRHEGSIGRSVSGLVAFLALALLFAIGSFAGDKVKLTNKDLQLRESQHHVYAGLSSDGVTWMVSTYPDGKRELYWNNGVKFYTAIGKARIDGDRICTQYAYESIESCKTLFKIGENQFESQEYIGYTSSTFFQLK